MSMSMHLYAVKPADDNYKRKADAWRACETAGVDIPDELVEFFDSYEPDPTGTVVPLGDDSEDAEMHPSCVLRYETCCQFEVDITKLPEGTRYVRFEVSR